MKEISLTNANSAIVDDADFSRVSDRKWYLYRAKGGKLYAMDARGNWLHRIVMRATDDQKIDHKNGDGLDNQRTNLRICTQKQNGGNSKVNRRNKSGFKGVYWYPSLSCWRTQCAHKHVGYFDTAEEAARAYDAAAMKEYGEFARPNFPQLPGTTAAA